MSSTNHTSGASHRTVYITLMSVFIIQFKRATALELKIENGSIFTTGHMKKLLALMKKNTLGRLTVRAAPLMCDCFRDSALKPDTVNPVLVLYCGLCFNSSMVLRFSPSSRHELPIDSLP